MNGYKNQFSETGKIKTCKKHHHKSGKLFGDDKMSFSRMHYLFTQSLMGNMPIKYVVLKYDFPMKDYRRAKIDVEQFWSRFSDSYPDYKYMYSIDHNTWNDCWYINLFICSVFADDLVPFDKLCSFWEFGTCMGVSIPEEVTNEFVQSIYPIDTFIQDINVSVDLDKL